MRLINPYYGGGDIYIYIYILVSFSCDFYCFLSLLFVYFPVFSFWNFLYLSFPFFSLPSSSHLLLYFALYPLSVSSSPVLFLSLSPLYLSLSLSVFPSYYLSVSFSLLLFPLSHVKLSQAGNFTTLAFNMFYSKQPLIHGAYIRW